MSWTFVGHVHTKYSFDSLTDPRALARQAVKCGIDVLAVTDHNTWQGAVATLGAVHDLGLPLRVVIASEVHTDQGDVIGLFLKDDLQETSALAFCDRVHEDGGLVLLPHPYRWHRLDDALLERVDLIEVYNGRTPEALNARAAALARERGLPEIAGPDAHRLAEVRLTRVEFEGDLPADEDGLKRALLEAPRTFHIEHGSHWNDWLSLGVSLMRFPSLKLAVRFVREGVRHARSGRSTAR
jgi:predicted metal-dependent phosphoesterase TrpH